MSVAALSHGYTVQQVLFVAPCTEANTDGCNSALTYSEGKLTRSFEKVIQAITCFVYLLKYQEYQYSKGPQGTESDRWKA